MKFYTTKRTRRQPDWMAAPQPQTARIRLGDLVPNLKYLATRAAVALLKPLDSATLRYIRFRARENLFSAGVLETIGHVFAAKAIELDKADEEYYKAILEEDQQGWQDRPFWKN